MWQVLGRARPVAAILFAATLLAGVEAAAQDNYINQNISGFNLPGVTLSQGHDEVRAADGTTCRSAVGGSGAYMDVGVIGNPEQDANGNSSMSAYGRIVVPLGKMPKRVDCSKLYDLEVTRLELELKLAQMGLGRGISPVSDESADGASAEMTGEAPADLPPVATALERTAMANAAAAEPVQKQPAKPVKVAQAAPKSAGWEDEGWSTDGLKK
jgi:hypothetical protein